MEVLWIVLLAVVGCILLFMEVLLPGAVMGIIGGICIVVAVVLGFNISTTAGLATLVCCLVGAPVAIFTGLWAMPKFGFAKRFWDYPILNDPANPKGAARTSDRAEQDAARESLLGKTGTAVTNLRPSGLVEIDGRRIDVVARGSAIDKGATVEVVDVSSNRVVVDELDNEK